MKKALFSWSGGKDSAYALYKTLKSKKYKIVSLLTIVTKDYGRISMHGVREYLLKKQAKSIGIPLEIVYITKKATDKTYEKAMSKTLLKFKKRGISTVMFGDIFLEGLKKHRINKMSEISMEASFPIWKRKTSRLSKEFIKKGFKSVVTCVDTRVLSKKFSGKYYNADFLINLPKNVDPCGENGEFHSFVYDGPIFAKKIRFKIGKKVLRNKRFYFCDIE